MNNTTGWLVGGPPKSLSFIVGLVVLALLGSLSPLHAQRDEPPVSREVELLERLHETIRSETPAAEVLAQITDAKLRLSQREVPARGAVEQRRSLARAWKLVGAISRDLDGDTPEVLEFYRIANSLDPEDEETARELAYRQRKFDAVNEQLEEARRLREVDEKAGRK
jgi:hypothetical protein